MTLRAKIDAWFLQIHCHGAMDLALDVTDMATSSYDDTAQGRSDFVEDAKCARDAVLDLCHLVPAHVRPNLTMAMREIDCALTRKGTIDDRLRDMRKANAAVERAHKAVTVYSPARLQSLVQA